MAGELLLSTVFETNFGWIGLARSSAGLKLSTLPKRAKEDCLAEIRAEVGETDADNSAFWDLPDRLVRYFRGEAVSFPDPLDFAGAPPFRRTAWLAARAIPYGQTRSYLWLAEQAGNARGARAAGQAMANNPVPIIVPCHRVIGSDGGLHGFGGGLELKGRMLRLEGAL